MPGYRAERVGEMIFREVAERLRSQIKDPRVTPISITHVEVTRDLSRAVLSYLPLGGGIPTEELREGLESAAKQMRGPIGRALRLRLAPELVFTYDTQIDVTFRVTALIDQVAADRKAREAAAGELSEDEPSDELSDDEPSDDPPNEQIDEISEDSEEMK